MSRDTEARISSGYLAIALAPAIKCPVTVLVSKMYKNVPFRWNLSDQNSKSVDTTSWF